MDPYKNLNGDSGVVEYEIGMDLIRVQFRNRQIFRYTNETAGRDHVERMKELARQGRGLSTYISQNKPGFTRE